MKLINNTQWNTKDLRNICNAVIKKIGSDTRQITITHSRGTKFGREGVYHGRASVGATGWNWIEMRVPKTIRNVVSETRGDDGRLKFELRKMEFNTETFAQVLEHEAEHNLGLRHKEMHSLWTKDVDYVKDFKVLPKEIKSKKKKDVVLDRFTKAQRKVKEYQSKLRRTENLLKKWQKKVKYYQKT